jgi:integrase
MVPKARQSRAPVRIIAMPRRDWGSAQSSRCDGSTSIGTTSASAWVSNFVRGKFGEPKSAASKKPVVPHSLVMGLLKNWRETTSYAGDEDFIFASDRLKGKQLRVPNMLVADHLLPAAKRVIEIPRGHRFGFHNLRHALTSFLVEIGTDSKTIQDMLR